MRVAILGAGVGGLALAHFLARDGSATIQVDLFEQHESPGGLVRKFQHRGRWFDRHYHVVLLSDTYLRALVRDLGLGASLTFQRSRSGFWDGQRVIPFDDAWDLIRLPFLGWVDKARLAATILLCQQTGDPEALHRISLEDWLVRWGGRRAYERLWAPLLRTKFDGAFDGIPATYLWSRIRRMQSTRGAGGAERLGILRGGTHALVDAFLAAFHRDARIHVHTRARVVGLETTGRRIRVSLEHDTPRGPYDVVVSTLPSPLHHRITVPGGGRPWVPLPDRYLGLVDVVVVLKRRLTPYYTLYLLDTSLPFTGVMETTNLMPPADRGDVHLVYLPRYTDPEGDEFKQDDETLKRRYLARLLQMFPDLDAGDVETVYLFRERFVEPVHQLGAPYPLFPEALETDHPGIYLMNTGRLYPRLHNCEAVSNLAWGTARFLLERHG